jgi:hypothetical protein
MCFVLVFVLYPVTCVAAVPLAAAEPSLIAPVKASTPLAALVKPQQIKPTRYYFSGFIAADSSND